MRLRRTLTTATAVVAVVLLGAQIAAAGPPPEGDKPGIGNEDPNAGSNIAYKQMVRQAPFVRAADAISALDPAKKQLAGIRLQVDDGGIEVFIKGDPSAEIRDEIARQEDNGVRVWLYGAEYSGAEMENAAWQIWAQRERYPGLVSLAANVDGSGVRMGVQDPKQIPDGDFPIHTDVVDDGQWHLTFSRHADTVPFWGGAEVAVAGNRCTSGFPVYRSNFFGVTDRGMILAEHCSPQSTTFAIGVTTGAGNPIGATEIPSVATEARMTDSLFMHANTSHRIYDGGTMGVGEFSKPVTGERGNYINQSVCRSGASTGTSCDIKTEIITLVMNIDGREVHGLVLGDGQGGSTVPVVGDGDSGGPVFTLDPADSNNVWAVGMADAGKDMVNCPANSLSGITCYHWLAWEDIGSIEHAQQVHVLTS